MAAKFPKSGKFIFLFSIFFIFNFNKLSLAQEWQELKGDHFIVYFNKDTKFAEAVLNKSEFYYQAIAADLGYSRYSEFWTWEKRVKIYIYPDQQSFLEASGQPAWSQGMADYTNKKIISYVWGGRFLEALLPHEIAHLIFRDFVGFKGEIPLWLDEGVAQMEEQAKRKTIRAEVRQLYRKNELFSLQDMMQLDIREIKEGEAASVRLLRQDGERRTAVLNSDDLVKAYYLQAASLVSFLIEKYGADNFAVFCRQLRDGKALNEALRFAYPTRISNLLELENEWKKYLERPDY